MGADSVSQYVAALAEGVRQRLAKLPEGLGSLTEAATEALEALPPDPDVGTIPVLVHAASGADLPSQRATSYNFGQPPVIVHRDERFFIEALTWVEGTTAIHQHAFEGAFAVADGLSLHVPYDFSSFETLADGHLVAGQLQMAPPEILRPGSVRAIPAGFDFIHALFHLERPTLTFVVRNDVELPYPQYSYMRPGIGWDQLNVDRQDGKRRQAVTALWRLDAPAAHRAIAEAVANEPPWIAFLFLRDLAEQEGLNDRVSELCDQLARRMPPLAGLLPAALADEAQQRTVLLRRKLLHQQNQRLILALLANLPDRSSVQTALGELHPGRRAQEVLWEAIAELASPSVRPLSGLRLSEKELDDLRRWLLAEDQDRSDAGPAVPELPASWQRLPALLRGLVDAEPADRRRPVAVAEGSEA